jgi:peptide/nickel transport system permease protein
MARYIMRRLVQSVILLALVTMIAFSLMHLAPGGPLAVYTLNPTIRAEDIERLERNFGLDRPLYIQYAKWATGMVQGDWGRSFRDSQPVSDIIFSRMWATFELAGSALAIAMILGIIIGTLGAVRQYSIADYLSTIGAMLALSIPTFWFGLMAIYLFSVQLGWLPSGGRQTLGEDFSLVDRLRHLLLPATVLGFVLIATWSRYTRASMLEVINQDFIRVARAKGLTERRIIISHGLRNALGPLVVLAGIQIPLLFGGALVTESVFTWPGMGRLFVDSLNYRDYPVMMGILFITAVLVILFNLLADVLAALIDPRVRIH